MPQKPGTAYPKPQETGGRLIRSLIRFCRQRQVLCGSQILSATDSDPKTIVIACSGGSDSVALLLLLARYGRKLVSRDAIRVLHINHGWRGQQSDRDERFVERLALKLSLPFHCVRLVPSSYPQGSSLEAAAHDARYAIFANWVQAGAVVLTAHTADDLAETVLWRLCTGKFETHSEGIRVEHQGVVRPLLFARKEELRRFLREERQRWREDPTNHAGRFLRSQMRQKLMPELERIFPRAVEHLGQVAQGQREAKVGSKRG